MLRIRELRLENNLTQKELAEKISFLMKRTSFERSANRLRGYHPCCLSLLYHILETFSIKNFNDAVFGVVFYVLALIQTAGRGIHYLSAFPAASPWRQLSPADKLQHRESRERLSVFLLPYPEARSPGFPVSIIPLFPLFARSGRPPPAPSRYIIYYKHI